jgi:hypothetical protein
MGETFLTEAQQRVLELRARGMSQAEIARTLKTSRANISILERRARKNIAKAERTVRLAARLRSPVVLEVKPGADIFSLPKLLFREADKKGVRIRMTSTDLVTRIHRDARERIQGRRVRERFEIAVTVEGEVLIV